MTVKLTSVDSIVVFLRQLSEWIDKKIVKGVSFTWVDGNGRASIEFAANVPEPSISPDLSVEEDDTDEFDDPTHVG